MSQMFVDTHGGPQPCALTGKEQTSQRGQRYVEIDCAYYGGTWWTAAYNVNADPAAFAQNTVKMREFDTIA